MNFGHHGKSRTTNGQIRAFVRQIFSGSLALFALVSALVAGTIRAQEWRSGQDSPVHDSDRLYPVKGDPIVLENKEISIAFDRETGALVAFTNLSTGWRWQTDPNLGESFNLFVPTADRSYNPVLGARNRLASFEKSADGESLTLVWSNLVSEYQGTLDITLHGTVEHMKGFASMPRLDISHAKKCAVSTGCESGHGFPTLATEDDNQLTMDRRSGDTLPAASRYGRRYGVYWITLSSFMLDPFRRDGLLHGGCV